MKKVEPKVDLIAKRFVEKRVASVSRCIAKVRPISKYIRGYTCEEHKEFLRHRPPYILVDLVDWYYTAPRSWGKGHGNRRIFCSVYPCIQYAKYSGDLSIDKLFKATLKSEERPGSKWERKRKSG